MGNKGVKSEGPKTLQDIRQHHGFTDEEFNEWIEIFRTHSGEKGYLTEAEFTDVYSSAFTGDPSGFIKHVFRSYDSNDDGKVDFKEFLAGISCSTSDDLETKLKWAFNVYDVDGDGVITKQEVTGIIKAMQCMISKHLSPEELQKIVDDVFCGLDKNSDGVINWKEFYTGVQNDERLLQIIDCEPQHNSQ